MEICLITIQLSFLQKKNFYLLKTQLNHLDRFIKKPSGNFGDISILSFHSTKTITTGEGGALLCNDKRIYEKMLSCLVIMEDQRKEIGLKVKL